MKRKRWLAVIAVFFLLWESAQAASLPGQVIEDLPPQAEVLLEELDEQSLPHELLLEGLENLWAALVEELESALKKPLKGVVSLLAVVLLCALAEACFRATGEKAYVRAISLAGALAITLITVGDVEWLMGQSVETIDSLHALSKTILPVLSAAVAASGGAVSAGFRHVAGVVFADLMITVIHKLLVPLVYFQVIASAATAMFSQESLSKVAKMLSGLSTWILTGMLALYTGYLTLIGAMTASADRISLQVARTAMGAVPVVGGIISDAAGTVLAGAEVLKNAVGVIGMLSVLAVCLIPFLELVIQYLLYKLAAILAGVLGPSRLTGLIEGLGGAFGLILGMTGACAMLLLLSLILSVTVVTL